MVEDLAHARAQDRPVYYASVLFRPGADWSGIDIEIGVLALKAAIGKGDADIIRSTLEQTSVWDRTNAQSDWARGVQLLNCSLKLFREYQEHHELKAARMQMQRDGLEDDDTGLPKPTMQDCVDALVKAERNREIADAIDDWLHGKKPPGNLSGFDAEVVEAMQQAYAGKGMADSDGTG